MGSHDKQIRFKEQDIWVHHEELSGGIVIYISQSELKGILKCVLLVISLQWKILASHSNIYPLKWAGCKSQSKVATNWVMLIIDNSYDWRKGILLGLKSQIAVDLYNKRLDVKQNQTKKTSLSI